MMQNRIKLRGFEFNWHAEYGADGTLYVYGYFKKSILDIDLRIKAATSYDILINNSWLTEYIITKLNKIIET